MPSPDSACRPVLVAVGAMAGDLRLIHAAFRIAREEGRPWVAVHVQVAGWESAEETEQARTWLREAEELGARTDWAGSANLVSGLLALAGRWAPATILLGRNRARGPWVRLEQARNLDLLRRACGARVVLLPLQSAPPGPPLRTSLPDTFGLGLAILALLAMTALFAAAVAEVTGLLAVPVVFGLALALVAYRWGWRFSLPATLASLWLGLRVFREPLALLGRHRGAAVLFFLAAAGLAQTLAALVARLREETHLVRRLQAETALLMLLGRALARCATREEVARVVGERVRGLLPARAWLLVEEEPGGWRHLPSADAPVPVDAAELAAPDDREDPLEPIYRHGASYIPLGRGEGFLRLQHRDLRPFSQEDWGLVQAFAVQAVLALDRIRWLETAHREHLEREAERTRNTLLGAVSHDLRTPLTTIQGAATTLLLAQDTLEEAERRDLLCMVREESERLARYLNGLLDLTKLQSGALQVAKEWQPVEEVVGAAVSLAERHNPGLAVRTEQPEQLLLAPLDAPLMTQVLVNLLENANRHAPGKPARVAIRQRGDQLELTVSDRGPGIPEAFRDRVFDKFFRLPGASGGRGAGLGLAICEAVVRAHGGRITAEEAEGGGACFRILLPCDGPVPDLPRPEADDALAEAQP